MLSSLGKGFMGFSRIIAIPLTAAGAFITLFVGNIANATMLRNPDAGLSDMAKSWFGFTQDPKSVLAIDPDLVVDPDTLLTGAPALFAGLESSLDGWGHIFNAAWDAAVPLAADIGLTGGAGSLVSAFSGAASVSEIGSLCDLELVSCE